MDASGSKRRVHKWMDGWMDGSMQAPTKAKSLVVGRGEKRRAKRRDKTEKRRAKKRGTEKRKMSRDKMIWSLHITDPSVEGPERRGCWLLLRCEYYEYLCVLRTTSRNRVQCRRWARFDSRIRSRLSSDRGTWPSDWLTASFPP